jgi:hypothetical protein
MLANESARRVYPRLRAAKETIVAWQSSTKRFVSAVDNFRLGGLFIRTPDPPAPGTFLQLLLDAPTGDGTRGIFLMSQTWLRTSISGT